MQSWKEIIEEEKSKEYYQKLKEIESDLNIISI